MNVVFCWLNVIVLCQIIKGKLLPQLHLYKTHRIRSNNDGHNCLYYYETCTSKVDRLKSSQRVHQIVPYCIRDMKQINEPINYSVQNFSFDILRAQNVSSEELYLWSAPVDVIEQYQSYLENPNTNSVTKQQLFYNCTLPLFGATCQFIFYEEKSFTEVVYDILKGKNKVKVFSPEFPCYKHLNCNRGPQPSCLDWREICDGKIDCLDGAEDEAHCIELEKRECKEHEYRCYNGAQCIPDNFFHDDPTNPDCADRSDEELVLGYTFDHCFKDPMFRCEEQVCPQGNYEHACGDGECTVAFDSCFNGRGDVLLMAMLLNESLSVDCRRPMICETRMSDRIDLYNMRCISYCSTRDCPQMIRDYCPPLFTFPSFPVLYGHIYFIYSNKQTEILDNDGEWIIEEMKFPKFICYEQHLCLFYPSEKTIPGYSACISLPTIPDGIVETWADIVFLVQDMFRPCSNIYDYKMNNNTHCHENNLFHCYNTSKCISKHRLLDGIRDCYLDTDETFTDSCLLNHHHRFKCTFTEKCLSPILIRNGQPNCPKYDDEKDYDFIESTNHIYFQTICDGFTELFPISIDGGNHTDETECDKWLCNNTYTRCDKYWNCLNGADEVDCPNTSSNICPSLHHACVSPKTNSIFCLHINYSGDGIVDCLGGTDERHVCRKSQQNFDVRRSEIRFLCSDTIECRSHTTFCNGEEQCLRGDDEQFCEHFVGQDTTDDESICELSKYFLSDVENFLCQLTDMGKPTIVYFALQPAQHSNTKAIVSRYTEEFPQVETALVSYLNGWVCNRGIAIHTSLDNFVCFCPPAYYGDLCQFQSQRISLTMKMKASAIDSQIIFTVVAMLMDEESNEIHSYEQFDYLSIRDCKMKFNIYLLYSTQPKEANKTFFIRVDAFDKHHLTYRTSWIFNLDFPFLPVHRLAVQLLIPPFQLQCTLDCGQHGQCMEFANERQRHFCLCDRGWMGTLCTIRQQDKDCDCSKDSLCVASSICVCPLRRFGSRCYLTRELCNKCINGDTCLWNSEYMWPIDEQYTCICPPGFSGDSCENVDTEINIYFHNVDIPISVFVHLIDAIPDEQHRRSTTFKKIPIDSESIRIQTPIPFNLVFLEFFSHYYLVLYQEEEILEPVLSGQVTPERRCAHITDLFNESVTRLHLIRRIKYYHIPCRERLDLFCYYDDIHLCICDRQRRANCFEFIHNMSYDCEGVSYCQNDGQCLQDDGQCPSTSMCVCKDCFYGARCQFSSKGFGLSLDVILGYHIRPNMPFSYQSGVVKVCTTTVILIVFIGFVNAFFSMITFLSKQSRKVGCGLYLLASSLTSLIIMSIFGLKFFLLLGAQMGIIKNRSFLFIQCISMDFLIQVTLNINNWLHACIAVERAFAVSRGLDFDRDKSRKSAKLIIFFLVIVNIATVIQDPINRRLVDDIDEQRTWCTITYSASLQVFNSIVILFHFLTSFGVNLIFAFVMIIMAARQRSNIRRQFTSQQHLQQQFQEHKQLIISPIILVILSTPRLIISFMSGCLKPTREPWLFLSSYFLSFIPTTLIFIVFVLPSELYKNEFKNIMKRQYIQIQRRLHLNT